VPKLGNQASN